MTVRTVWRGALVAGLLLAPGEVAFAQADACALLKPADLATLLGAGATSKAAAAGCTWSSVDGKRKIIAIRPGGAGIPGATMFAGARGGAAQSGTVTDQAGLGDKAFAVLESFGVVLMVLKQDRVLQLQYYPGAAGTTKDLDALLPVAKVAAAAF